MRNKSMEFKKNIRDELSQFIIPKIESCDIKTIIGLVFELEDVQKARDLMES